MMDVMTGYNKIKAANMYGADELTAIIMNIVQAQVREVNANQDFKDWSTEFLIKVCTNHGDKEKELFGDGR